MMPIRHTVSEWVAASLTAAMMLAATAHIGAAGDLPKNIVMHDIAKAVPAISFEDGQGHTRSLADLKGKVVLLNVWATWCVSCRHEMPALDRLQAMLGTDDFAIVPLSIDRGGRDAVAKFYADTGVKNLATDIDLSGRSLRELGAMGLPTSLIIDRAGQEVGRIVGPLEWDEPEVVELLRSVIAKPRRAATNAQDTPARDTRREGGWMGGFRWLKALFTQ